MRPSVISVLFAGVFVCHSLAAQVSVSLSALTPLTVTATDGAISNSNTHPVGPMATPLFGLNSAVSGPGSSYAAVGAGAEATNNMAYANVGLSCINTSATASTSTNMFEVLVTFSAATATPVWFHVSFDNLITAGATAPLALVDVDNDGTIDYANGQLLNHLGPRTIGPLGIQIRVILQGSLQQVGEVIQDVSVRMMPDNNLHIYPGAIGCINSGPDVQASFLDTGVTIGNQTGTSTPSVFVFGLATQPVILPTITALPCLLLPRPDLVLTIPVYSSIELGLPPSVRPVTIYIQNVELHGGSLYTGYASQVITY